MVQILENKLDALTDEEQQDAHAMPQHQNLRGSDYYQ